VLSYTKLVEDIMEIVSQLSGDNAGTVNFSGIVNNINIVPTDVRRRLRILGRG